jgi:hypothetical protein
MASICHGTDGFNPALRVGYNAGVKRPRFSPATKRTLAIVGMVGLLVISAAVLWVPAFRGSAAAVVILMMVFGAIMIARAKA